MQSNPRQTHRWATLQQRTWRGHRVLLTSVGVTGCVVALRLAGWLQAIELVAFDQFFRLRPLEPIDERIVLVGIDEPDLRKVGRWPVPDDVMAQLLEKIRAAKPRAIGLDVYRNLVVEPGHDALLQLYRTTPNLIGIEQIQDGTSPGVSAPPVLGDRKQVGFNNLVADPDGVVRRGLLYWTLEDGSVRTSFALALALLYLKPENVKPQMATDGSKNLQLGKTIFPPFQANDGSYVWTDAGGYQLLANLRGPAGTFHTIPMSQVLQGQVPPEVFRDRIVMVGHTASSLKDFFYTSYSGQFINEPRKVAGVELQANLVSQIVSSALEGRPLIQIWSDPVEWLWVFVWAWVGARLSWSLRSPHKSAFAILISGAGLVSIAYLAFLQSWWLPVVPPMLAMAGSAIVIIAHIAHLEEELKRSKEFLNTIINTIPDPIFVKDSQHRWIVLNQAFCKLLGYPVEEVLHKSDYDVFPRHEADIFRHQDQQVFNTEQAYENEESFTNRNGITYFIETKRSLHKDAAGNLFLVGVIRDITERKRMEEELKRTAAELVRSNAELQRSATQLSHLANHDTLTGLPNRKLFYERLTQALEWADMNQQLVGLLFLDLDGFKLINDTLGHDVGDLLLKAVAQRLTRSLRGSDTVSRLGGDEFTVILPAIPSAQDAARVAEKILKTLADEFLLEQQIISVTSSIGIALYPNDGKDADTLVKEADLAMYRAKQQGKSRYEFARVLESQPESTS
ncbi:CHASE2 domain-containing protein [Pantanalinema rosaneae CENA516]|uniref:CHASE2 domain-containing protein n=1 Tax=Pantanalinema rosaneae TaxID=1620701 RepID=UPI003D6E9E2C